MLQFFKQLFRTLGIKYTDRFLSQLVSETPYISSMFGISSILSRYNITNECVRVADKEDIKELEDYGIVLFEERFVIVCPPASDKKVNIIRTSGERESIPKEEFFDKWNGIIILAERNRNSGEPEYNSNRRLQRLKTLKNILLTVCVAIFALLSILSNPNIAAWLWWTIVIVNILGCGVSFLLLQKQLHIPNRFADRLCGLTKESRCEKVTDSKGATLFGLVKLSEVGAGFFSVNLLLLMLAPQAIGSLAICALCVLPFSFWSVWYQKFKARSWCVLCLITLALMWMQGAMYLIGGFYEEINLDILYLAYTAALYGAFTLGINRFMAVLENQRTVGEWHLRYNELRMRDEVVEAIERKAPEFDTDSDTCSAMVFGNQDAKHQITVFSNPYCGHCTAMHERIKNLPGENVCVRYVMTTFSDELSDINRYLIAAYQQLGAEKTWKIMTDWYAADNGRDTRFFDGLGLDINTADVSNEFEKQMKWRANDKLSGTPTVIINGREVIDPYTVEDYMFIPK